jgi:hypothetical protein
MLYNPIVFLLHDFLEVTFSQNSFYKQMHLLLTVQNVKIYIKISYIRSYMFRSTWTILRELTLSLVKVTLLWN